MITPEGIQVGWEHGESKNPELELCGATVRQTIERMGGSYFVGTPTLMELVEQLKTLNAFLQDNQDRLPKPPSAPQPDRLQQEARWLFDNRARKSLSFETEWDDRLARFLRIAAGWRSIDDLPELET